jgi:hypothetical protein
VLSGDTLVDIRIKICVYRLCIYIMYIDERIKELLGRKFSARFVPTLSK